MYEKNKSQRITLRLSDDQFAYIVSNAEALKISPSDFLRILIDSNIALSLSRK